MCMEVWSSHGCAWRLGVVMDVPGGLEQSWMYMEAWSSHGCAWRLGVVMVVHGGFWYLL